MCSNFYKIYTLWEYPHKSLEQELVYRKMYRKQFEEQ